MQRSVIFKLACVFILGLLIAGTGFSATTGKISGRVTDAKTGEPLPGVNVVIEGTQMGAATDLDGYYFIINIRPGQYALTATMIGYTPLKLTGVGVNVDRTTVADFKLEEKVLEASQEVTVVAERAIVPLDVSSTQQIISPEQLENAAYKDLANVMHAQVGISGFGANASHPRFRGQDYTNGAMITDGMAMTDEIRNRPYMKINMDAVQEIQVITGGFNAEYGNVRSGLINVVTKEGGDRYTGSIDFKYSPAALKGFGPMIYGKDSPLVRPFLYAKDGAWTGYYREGGMGEVGTASQFFPGWFKYSGVEVSANGIPVDASGAELSNWWDSSKWVLGTNGTLQPGDPHYGEPYENLALYLWRHRSKDNLELLLSLAEQGKVNADVTGIDPDEDDVYEYGDEGDFVGSFTFGGPIPFLNGVKFFASHREEKTYYARVFPQDHYRDRLTNLKLTTNLNESMKLNLNFLYGKQSGTNGSQGGGIGIEITNNAFSSNSSGFESDVPNSMSAANKMWYPYCNVTAVQERVSMGFQFTHVLSPSTFYEVTFSHLLTEEGHDMYHRNTIKIQGNEWNATHLQYGRLGTADEIQEHIDNGDYDWENWQNYARVKIGDYWYDEGPWGYGPVNWRDVTGEYRMESCNLRENNSVFRKYVLKAAVTSQVNRFNQIKAGFELQHDKIHGEYGEIDPSVNGGSWYFAKAKPWSGALFVQDKLEFQGMIANLGLRMDVQKRGEMINNTDPNDPNASPYTRFLQAGKSDSLDMLNWEGITQARISPRVGISHPISNDAKIFFNYGHFYKWPSAYDLYYYRQRTTDGWRISNLGNPSLVPPKTIMYEVGYAHNLMDMFQLTATGYYKDVSDEYNEIRYYPMEGSDVRFPENNQYRDIRGVELMAELRRGTFVTGFTSYEYMISSRGRYGTEYYREDPNSGDQLWNTDITQPVARPVWKVNVDFHTPADFGYRLAGYPVFADMNLNFLYYWRAGEVFTWNPKGIPYVEDNIRWRPYQRTDMRFTKRLFHKWGMETVFYVDVFNVFNNKNMTYPDDYSYGDNRVLTGVNGNWAWNDHKWWNGEFRAYMNSLDIEGGDRPGDYPTDSNGKDYIVMPSFTPWTFLEKRDIFFGIKINFY